ncbi:MAG: hypothetical protein A4E74_00727 [Syntrophus sp. PtaB.Bin075]|nr:MAG: hypothetical protein A4E74_00727 [Syntrophus sp. PtaB.Bin075]
MGRDVSRFRKNLYRLITGKREFSKQFVAVFPAGLRPAGKRRISAGTQFMKNNLFNAGTDVIQSGLRGGFKPENQDRLCI